MKRKVILITGGQRCGKSEYAERLALQLSDNPVYVATAHAYDDEFRERIRRHKLRRGAQWSNIEEELKLSAINVSGKVVLIDCVTLWATNFFFANNQDTDLALDALKTEFDRFIDNEAQFIFVTNEIGLGGVSENAMSRHFTDLLGHINQHIASKADEVTLIISGIPLKIK
ncbi:MAG: bifunctional adenosylcobinamide kinase/adenosylcobinamide-phosphate guanylyltransferase [Duncaniella sp.]|nr:bifunctional adenosylcobinamide kinase/adenosylcobinamide-phosphate guanylyltransferase [Duncaniella sp.]